MFASTAQQVVSLDQAITDNLSQLINGSRFQNQSTSSVQSAAVESIQNGHVQSIGNENGTFGSPSELFLTILPASQNDTGNRQTDVHSRCDENDMTTTDDGDNFIDCSQVNCCKGHQRVLNKIDYVHKKFSKELSLLREETTSIRKMLLQLLDHQWQGQQNETAINEDDGVAEQDSIEPVKVDVAEIDDFNEKFTSTFPIEDADTLIEFNKSMRGDQKFMNNLFARLAQMKGEDEIKTTRKILKALCSGTCLKDFTWQGTKRMKSFANLHLIVELLKNLLKEKYPGCDALDIVTKVVKQRTKSAKEGKDRNTDSSVSSPTPPGENLAAKSPVLNVDIDKSTIESVKD